MKDDSARDKAIDQLLASRLRGHVTAQDPQGPACLEAETLAAYIEHTLAPYERSTCEAHLAACLRCQEQVAQLVRVIEAEEPGEGLARARAAPARAPKITWFRWAWAAPALVTLTVAGLWFEREHRHLQRQPEEAALKTQAPPAQPAIGSSALQEKPAPAAKHERRELDKARQSKKEISNLDLLAGSAAQKIPTPESQGTLGKPTGAAPATEQPARVEPAVGAAGAIASPGERAQLAAPASAGGQAVEKVKESKETLLSARAKPPSAGPSMPPKSAYEEGLAKQSLARSDAGGSATALLNPPSPARNVAEKTGTASAHANWRVGPHGLIQKGDPSGNWVTKTSGVETDLYDITFPSTSEGWAVGQAGTVLRTTDGGTSWSKISIHTAEDLVRVTAASEHAARVVTRSGQTLATTDGGKSWSSPP